MRLPSTRSTVTGRAASTNAPSETTLSFTPSNTAMPAGRRGVSVVPVLPTKYLSSFSLSGLVATSLSTSFEFASRPLEAECMKIESATHKRATMISAMISACNGVGRAATTPATRRMQPRMPGAPKPGRYISSTTSPKPRISSMMAGI